MRWRGRLIRARMASMPDRSNSWALDLSARIGRVPSTAGQAPDERARRRHEVLQVLRCLPELASPGLRLCLAADHAVMVEARTDFCVPISAVTLVTKLAVFMMALSPYLDVLDEAGAGVSYGIAAT